MDTDSTTKDSCSSSSNSIKKKLRKIRCTQEFSDLERKSILSEQLNGESKKKLKTRKRKNKQFLPQIQLDMDIATNKENVILNSDSTIDETIPKKVTRSRNNKDDVDFPQIDKPILLKRSQRKKLNNSTIEQSDLTDKQSGTSTENDDMKDLPQIPDISLKRRRKQTTSTSDPTNTKQNDTPIRINDTENLPQVGISEISKKRSRKNKLNSSANEQSDPMTTDSETVFKQKNRKRKIKRGKVITIGDSVENEGNIEKEYQIEDKEKVEHDIEISNVEQKSSEDEFMRRLPRQSILKKSSILTRQSNVDSCEIPSGNVLIEDIEACEDDDDFELKEHNELGRKSVRFITPSKESVTNRRSTFDVQNNTFDVSVLKSLSFKEQSTRSESSFKSYRKSPYIKKNVSRLHSDFDAEDDDSSLEKVDNDKGKGELSSPSLAKYNVTKNESITKTPPEVSVLTTDDKSSAEFLSSSSGTLNSRLSSGRRSTFEMPSPIFGPQEQENATITNNKSTSSENPINLQPKFSIINLITPTSSPKKKSDDSVVILDSGKEKLVRESTFTRYEKMCEEMDDTKSGTVTKKENIADKQADSSLKKGKRKTWNKSLRVSILNNSGLVQNVTAPWSKEQKDISIQETETPKGNKAMIVEKLETPMPSIITKTPPSGTSTPLPSNKKYLLRTALLRDMRVKIDESKNSTSVIPKPKGTTSVAPKPTKMPNFALIHQKAFNKMENLQQMSERKASRAKLLLSGQKPTLESKVKRKSPSKNRRMLHYSPKTATTQTTPKLASNSITKVKTITPSTSNPRVLPKATEFSKTKSCIPKLKSNKIVAEKKSLTKMGFRVGPDAAKSITKEEQIRAVIKKSKVPINTVEHKRNELKNVRTNRRFELLMKMRNQNKS